MRIGVKSFGRRSIRFNFLVPGAIFGSPATVVKSTKRPICPQIQKGECYHYLGGNT